MSEISRKQFLTTLAAASVASVVGVSSSSREQGNKQKANLSKIKIGSWKISPLADKNYSGSFLRFCETARFNSVEHALMSIRNPQQEFIVSQLTVG